MAAQARKDLGTARPKYRYQVTNGAECHRALVSRGDRTIWFDDETIGNRWTPPPSVGRSKPDLYSTLAIQTCLALKTLLRLPYRAIDGLMKSLMRLNGRNLPVPGHTYLSRPAAQLSLKIPRRTRTGAVHVEIATTDWGESKILPDLLGPAILPETAWFQGVTIILQAIAGGCRDGWKDVSGYHRRSLTNNMMFHLKHQCDRMFSRACERRVADAKAGPSSSTASPTCACGNRSGLGRLGPLHQETGRKEPVMPRYPQSCFGHMGI